MTDITHEFEADYALHPDAHLKDDVARAKPPPPRQPTARARRTFRRTERRSLMRQSVRGAVSSLTASTLMGGLLVAAQRLGLLGGAPLTTRKVRGRLDVRPRGADLALQLGYGALVGALSGPLLERIPNRSLRVLGGVATGAAAWAASSGGWLPGLGWAPADEDKRATRPLIILGAHLVFGAVLGASLPSADHVHELDLDDDPHVEAIGLA